MSVSRTLLTRVFAAVIGFAVPLAMVSAADAAPHRHRAKHHAKHHAAHHAKRHHKVYRHATRAYDRDGALPTRGSVARAPEGGL